MIRSHTIPQITAAGTSSPTTGPVVGEILGVHVANNSAGTLTVRTVYTPQVTVLTLTAAGTGWYYPRAETCYGTAGTVSYDGTYAVCEPFPVIDYMESVLNAAGTASVTLYVRE